MDDSTSSSDDDANVHPAPIYRRRINMNMNERTDEQFVEYFRLSKAGFNYVHEHDADLVRPARMYAYTLSSRQRLLICIRLAKEFENCTLVSRIAESCTFFPTP